jgi:hypothetical protein
MRVFKRGAAVFAAAFVFVLLFAAVAYAAPSGAIFTTMPYGAAVNANTQYTSKAQVFLSGGPGPNAPTWAAGLPDGAYYFMVTDPAGKKLLSTDALADRKIMVKDGVIINDGTTAKHLLQPDLYRGNGWVVQLIPFLDTPNPGGVYKAWATPVGKYDLNGNGNKFGFVPAWSKTDNFKIKESSACFDVLKFKDECWDGAMNGNDAYIEGWPILIREKFADGTVIDNYRFTPVTCWVMDPEATYEIYEGMMDGDWYMTGLWVNGKNIFPGTDFATLTFPTIKGKGAKSCVTQTVLFGNGICEYSTCDYTECPYCDDCATGLCDDPCCSCQYDH